MLSLLLPSIALHIINTINSIVDQTKKGQGSTGFGTTALQFARDEITAWILTQINVQTLFSFPGRVVQVHTSTYLVCTLPNQPRFGGIERRAERNGGASTC